MLHPEMVLLLMPSLGIPELMIIFLIIMVLFGASRLPQIGKGLGEGIKNFKKGIKAADEEGEQIPEKSETRNV
jgi:sec-independent protein translocase protein TatA